jgi:hypothetical protein
MLRLSCLPLVAIAEKTRHAEEDHKYVMLSEAI